MRPEAGSALPPLYRHRLVAVSTAGWRSVLDRPWDDRASACLRHWAERELPLVVTRQPTRPGGADGPVALGLSAPPAWGRRALSLRLSPSMLGPTRQFPFAAEVLELLPRDARPAVRTLVGRLESAGVRARAYGSFGWQRLTGLDYVHARSDLDLWCPVEETAQADEAAGHLLGCAPWALRLDGELVFPDGAAVAWREWAAWRAGRTRGVLVKRLHGVGVEEGPFGAQAGEPLAEEGTA